MKLTTNKNKALVNLLNQYKDLTYLRGVALPELGKPQGESQSGFLVFKGTRKENYQTVILKILWEEKFLSRFQSEAFAYKLLLSKKGTKSYIPTLFNSSEKGINYLEIKFLERFRPIGKTHQITIKIKKNQLKNIFTAIHSLHLLSQKKIDKIPPFLKPSRTSRFYLHKLINLDTGKRINKYFSKELTTRIINFINNNKNRLNQNNCLIWSDRNPSNILINKKGEIKLIDFDRIGRGNPSLDYSFLFIISQIQSQYSKELSQFLKKRYTNDKNFWVRFYIDSIIRLVDEYNFWLKKNKSA